MAGVAALPNHEFEWLPWSYWRYEGRRCSASKDHHAAKRSFLLNSRAESFHMLNIEFRVDRLIPFKKFVMDNPFPVSTTSFYADEDVFSRAGSLVCRG